MSIKVAILDDYQNIALQMAEWSILKGKVEITVFSDHLSDPERIVERLTPFDVVCVMRERTPMTRAILERLPNLKLICSTGIRNVSIDLKAAQERGITVCSTGYTHHGAVEVTWALILGIVRNLPEEVSAMRTGKWQVSLGGDLAGKTLGIVGLGRIGSEVARIANAFKMNVIAWSPNLVSEKAASHGATLVTKEALFRESDIVTLHLILGARSRGVVGATELSWMKPGAYLINSSRGPLVDEEALISTLQRRAIAGAALDVYDSEPLPESHPFRSLKNVVATPHVGFVTRETYGIFFRDTVENISAWLSGNPVRLMSL
ncbi:MAG TPA: D-2-hydroxyacid dehydrogenase family protein [Terriglobales bacterium]|nr:D-2-hydroxyacid dehydrogenase family protein [Terriglobales bacterium]